MNSELQTAVARAIADERRRFARIIGTPEAAGREQLALAIATTTSKSVDEARAALAAAPAAAAGSLPSAADAIRAERNRLAAITSLPEAKGREGLAMSLATTTDLTVDQAKAALAAAPAAANTSARAGDTGLVVDQGEQLQQNSRDVSAMWDTALASRGLRLQASVTPHLPHSARNNDRPLLPDWEASLKSRGMSVGDR